MADDIRTAVFGLGVVKRLWDLYAVLSRSSDWRVVVIGHRETEEAVLDGLKGLGLPEPAAI